ncbi:Tetratricopeptide repeat protein [uncultured Desulfatiglans sp.]|nr:Tetratricopeptide repeat protein [uncultured Desulfatiglans sp.]
MTPRWISRVLLGLILLLMCGGAPGDVFSSEVVIRSDQQFAFARQFLDRGDYPAAAAEFERFRYFFPDDPRGDEALYLIGFCRLREGRHDEARTLFGRLVNEAADPSLAARAMFLAGESYYEEGRMEEASAVFEEVVRRYPGLEIKNAALYRLGWVDLRRDQWEKASAAFEGVSPESPLYGRAGPLAGESLKGPELPWKEPSTAGMLAAVLPGAGHAYVGRWKDGLVALLLNGVFIWAAVEAFDSDQDVLGGILAFLEAGWYSGNIYSAVNAAHKFNRKVRDDFRKGLDERLDLRLFTGGGGAVGLGVSWRF